ncbi:MAG: hypothetical protein WC764_04360 [Candidatus Paceibacterota bacterium]|jgi:hypothetical protein
MAITVSIGGVDKSDQIEWESLSVEQVKTSQIDTCSFKLKKHAGKTYSPAIGDSVLVQDGATSIFGGIVVKINNSIEAGLLTRLAVQCVSYEKQLDRYLAVREFTSVSARYILNALLDEFVNQPSKEIDLGESTETWTTEDGTVAANTTAGQFIEGSQSRKFTATASNTATARRETTLDLTLFSDATASTTSDKIKFYVYVDTLANLASIRLLCVSDAGATYTNYYETTVVAASLVAGWNEIIVLKSAFTSSGSPNWNDIKKRQYRVTASASGTVNVSIDDCRLIKSTAFTMGSVKDADAPTIGSVKFNYESVSSAIKQVAEMVGCDWYIDPVRVLHFFAPLTEPAPFGLTDTSANFAWDSLDVSQDSATVKNQIYVRGGEYQGASTDFDTDADGVSLNYRSPYRIKNLTVTVAAVSKTVGVDNLADPASYDCLYNFMEKTLKFKTATKPTAGQLIKMTGNPMIPVIIKKGDASSIATHGIYEFLILDKTILTQQGARDRASAELTAYRDTLIEGSFTTDTTGLRAGQTISIAIAARGISDTYIVQSVYFRTKSPTGFIYDIKIVSTRSFGVIEYLLGLLRDSKKQITMNDDEVIDEVQDIDETATVADVWTQGSMNAQTETITFGEAEQDDLNHGTVFVLTPYVFSGFADTKRPFILDGSLLS